MAAEDMTDAVWDYICLDTTFPAGARIPEELLKRMKREFDYWYPFDLRVALSPFLYPACLPLQHVLWHIGNDNASCLSMA